MITSTANLMIFLVLLASISSNMHAQMCTWSHAVEEKNRHSSNVNYIMLCMMQQLISAT